VTHKKEYPEKRPPYPAVYQKMSKGLNPRKSQEASIRPQNEKKRTKIGAAKTTGRDYAREGPRGRPPRTEGRCFTGKVI